MAEAIRVLLVDNEPPFCEDMSAYLSSKGFHVETATSGSGAMERVLACRGNFDVAVIDQVMGPPNGTEIMLQIRRRYSAIEVLILTAWGNMEPGEKAMELGAYRYMSKPVVAEELAFNIRTAARLSREQRRRLALEALVRSGVGHLRLIDFDEVGPSNLNRQLMSTVDLLGHPKATAAAARGRRRCVSQLARREADHPEPGTHPLQARPGRRHPAPRPRASRRPVGDAQALANHRRPPLALIRPDSKAL